MALFDQPAIEPYPLPSPPLNTSVLDPTYWDVVSATGTFPLQYFSRDYLGVGEARWKTDPQVNQEVFGLIHAMSGTSTFRLRCDLARANCYALEWGNEHDYFRILKRVAGVETQLAIANFGDPGVPSNIPVSGVLVGFRVFGSLIQCHYSTTGYFGLIDPGSFPTDKPLWNLMCEATDTDVTAAGYFFFKQTGGGNGVGDLISGFNGGQYPAPRRGAWLIPTHAPAGQHATP